MKSIRCWIVNRWSVALCTLALLCAHAVLVHAQDYDAAARDQVAPESLTVRVFGNTAIAIGVIAVKGTKGGKSVVRRERFIDTWINKNGSWICIATNATPITHGGS